MNSQYLPLVKSRKCNTAAGLSSDNRSVNNILSGSPTHDTNAPVDGNPILENSFHFYSITPLRADTTANPEELAITNNDPSSAWINLGNRMRKENHLNVLNFTCNITTSSVGLEDDPHAHSVYDEHSIYDDLNNSSNHCTVNINKPSYVSADSGSMPVSPETYNVTQDVINDLLHNADPHQS